MSSTVHVHPARDDRRCGCAVERCRARFHSEISIVTLSESRSTSLYSAPTSSRAGCRALQLYSSPAHYIFTALQRTTTSIPQGHQRLRQPDGRVVEDHRELGAPARGWHLLHEVRGRVACPSATQAATAIAVALAAAVLVALAAASVGVALAAAASPTARCKVIWATRSLNVLCYNCPLRDLLQYMVQFGGRMRSGLH